MEIALENISKKFETRWIFKNLTYKFSKGGRYALTGPNGSGKSTLINIIVAKTPFSKGKITYSKDQMPISVDNVYKEVSIATTAMSVIEEFTLEELVKFHFRFRQPIANIKPAEVFQMLDLERERKKIVSNFSSGMKQRLKIGLALYTDSSVLLLDEPGATLDENSRQWYQENLKKHLNERLLIIASNEVSDFDICDESLNIADYAI